jgi:spermidine synthase
MAAYCQPGQYFRFYEINPEMQRLAEEHFSYLKDCRGQHDVVLGDGRLSLESEQPQQFDLLVLDAFSGDAVPAHLLTREAMDIYLKHLTPKGEVAFNISNRYLNLVPVIERLAGHAGFTALHISSAGDAANGQFPAEWMVLSRNADTLAALRPFARADEQIDPQFALWTDHHSNLFEILK